MSERRSFSSQSNEFSKRTRHQPSPKGLGTDVLPESLVAAFAEIEADERRAQTAEKAKRSKVQVVVHAKKRAESYQLAQEAERQAHRTWFEQRLRELKRAEKEKLSVPPSVIEQRTDAIPLASVKTVGHARYHYEQGDKASRNFLANKGADEGWHGANASYRRSPVVINNTPLRAFWKNAKRTLRELLG